MLTPEIREFAQVPDRYTRLSNDVRRYADDRACILEGTVWSGVAGVRVGPAEVAALLDDVRSRVPPGKRTTWWIDPGSEPPDLYDHLLALGLQEPEDGHGVVHALACVEAPPPGPAEVEARR